MPKEFLTYQQQMEKLRSSGLRIEDEVVCRRVLADIGYFPVVNGYQSFFRDPSTRVYREGATFGDILALYEFDVQLREIMLDALLKIEAKIRSAVAYEFCAAYADYACGKVDVFSAVITLRYLLRDDEFKAFKAKLVKCVNGYLSLDESIGEERLLKAMGFPTEWKKITRYKI